MCYEPSIIECREDKVEVGMDGVEDTIQEKDHREREMDRNTCWRGGRERIVLKSAAGRMHEKMGGQVKERRGMVHHRSI